MARPLWLRLFGPNGPTNVQEFRDAIRTAPIGQALGDVSLFPPQFQRIFDRADPAAPAPRPPFVDPVVREQGSVAAAIVTDHDLATAPASVSATDVITDAAAPPLESGPGNLIDAGSDPSAVVHINGIVSSPSLAGGPSSPFARLDTSVPYKLIGDLETGLVIDTRNKTLMAGGPGDYPELLAGPNDTLELEGDYSAGSDFTVHAGIEQVIFHAGNDYNLVATDASVGRGSSLTVNAMPLGDANHVVFDGSAETDGRFLFYGSDAGDVFLGGAGDDRIYGLGGGDVLGGGGGRDTFTYYDAAHSSGTGYDTLADFDPTADRIDLEVAVTGFDASVAGGTLSTGSFDADLGAALSGLGAGHAVLFAPDAGDLAGSVFLVVDANGIAGYQEGEDYVFALAGSTLTDLSGQTGFFI